MRDIKFRAWDLKEEMMWEVSGVDLGSRTVDVFIIKYNPRSGQNERVNNFDMRYPGRVVLMQFTGLKDKNGKEIYEGDIVRLDTPQNPYHPTRTKTIIWHQKFAQFCIEPCTGISFWKSVEIIGNVHQNPELK